MQPWKPSDILRHRHSGRPLLVVHVYRNCTVVADLEDKSNPTAVSVLLERDYGSWAKEQDMDCKIEQGYIDPKITWTPSPPLSPSSLASD